MTVLDQPLLTDQQRRILTHIALGETNAEIGQRLCLSTETVKAHIVRVFKRLGARNRAHVVHLAYRAGIVVPPGGHVRPMPRTPRAIESRIYCALFDQHPALAQASNIHAEPGRGIVFVRPDWPVSYYESAIRSLPWDCAVEWSHGHTALTITPRTLSDEDRAERAADAATPEREEGVA